MKNLGYLLITAGFLFGSYFSVVDSEHVSWGMVAPALVLGLVGVALIWLGKRGERQATDAVQAGLERLEESLANIVRNVTELDEKKGETDPYEVRHLIDAAFMDDLDTFVQSRERIAHRFGLQAYANIMSHFATGERYLNRCWSASTNRCRSPRWAHAIPISSTWRRSPPTMPGSEAAPPVRRNGWRRPCNS